MNINSVPSVNIRRGGARRKKGFLASFLVKTSQAVDYLWIKIRFLAKLA